MTKRDNIKYSWMDTCWRFGVKTRIYIIVGDHYSPIKRLSEYICMICQLDCYEVYNA